MRTPDDEDRSGTDERCFLFSASANLFNHPHVGVARTNTNGKMVNAAAVEQGYLYGDTGSAALWIGFTDSGQRYNARQMIRRSASMAGRRVAPAAAEMAWRRWLAAR